MDYVMQVWTWDQAGYTLWLLSGTILSSNHLSSCELPIVRVPTRPSGGQASLLLRAFWPGAASVSDIVQPQHQDLFLPTGKVFHTEPVVPIPQTYIV